MLNNCRDAKRPRSQGDTTILASVSGLKGCDFEAFLEELARKVSTLPAHPDDSTGWWCAHQPLMKELLPYLAEDLNDERFEFRDDFRVLVADQISRCRLCCIQYHKTILDFEMEDHGDFKLAACRIRSLLNWDVQRLLPKLRRLAQQVRVPTPNTNRPGLPEKNALLETLHNFRICVKPNISELIGVILSRETPLDMTDIVPVVKKIGAVPSGVLALCFHQKPAVNSWAHRLCVQLSKICHPHRLSVNALLPKVAKQLERSTFDDSATGGNIYAPDKRTGWEGFATVLGCLDAKAVAELCTHINPNKLFKICTSAMTDSDDEVVIRSSTCVLRLFEAISSDRLFSPDSTPHQTLQNICTSLKQGRRRMAQRKLLDLIAPAISGARKMYDHKGICRLFQRAFEFIYKEVHCEEQSVSEPMVYTSIGSTDRPSLDRSAILKCGARLLEAFYSHSAPSLPIRSPAMISNFVLTVLREESESDCSWDLLRVVLVTDAFNLLRVLCSPSDAREVAAIYPLRRAESLMSTGQEARVVECFKEMQLSTEKEDSWVLPLWTSLRTGIHSPINVDTGEIVSEHEVRLLLDLHMVIGMVDCARLDDASDRKIGTGSSKDGRIREISRADAGRLSASDRLSVMQSTISDRFFSAYQTSGTQGWWDVLPFHATHLLASAQKNVSHKAFAALRKSKNTLGASCFGSQSKLLATILKDDPVSAKMVADGCYAAMRIIDALGYNSSIRAFPSVMLWYRVLLESTYNDLFDSGDHTCAVGVIAVFATNWRRFEQSTEDYIFREVCCRLFTNLRDVWDHLLLFDSGGDDESYMNADGRKDGLRKALNGIISMHRLRDRPTRVAWVSLICNIGQSWRNTDSLREQMVIAIQYHESSRKMLSYEECHKIAEAGGLTEVDVTMHRWSRDEEIRVAQRDSKSKNLRTTTIHQFFSSVPQADKMFRAVVEKKNSNTPFIGKGFASKEARSLKPPSNTRSLKMPGQSSAILELRKDTKAVQRSKLKRDFRTAARAQSAEGGKTQFELLVAKNQAEKKTRKAAESRHGAIEIDAKIHAGGSKRQTASSTSTRLAQRPAVVGGNEHGKIEAAKKRFSLPFPRRHLRPREVEQIYRNILGQPQNSISLPSTYSLNSGRHSYTDIEEYVSYWEPFIVSEFQSSVQKTISEEEILWNRESVKASFSPWRASFKVEGAMESIGYVQHITVRCCEEDSPFNTKRRSNYTDYEISRIQVSDLVQLFIPPPKFAKKTPGVHDTFTALGLVLAIVRKPSEFSLTLKMAFDRLDKAPGNGREIQVIRLLSTTTFQRQLDALWRLPKVCNGVLRTILSPREGIDVNKAVCHEQMRLFSNAVATRSQFIEDMRARRELNDSQREAIAEVLKSCSPLFRSQEAGTFRYDHVADHGSFTMIQGPPGTGKTSTIIAMMSALLLPGAQNQTFKNVSIAFDNGSAVVRVPKVRILVCAPSNAAVDEIMLRVIEKGLFTAGGFRVTPMMVRVGGGTTNEALKAFEVWDTVERRMARNGLSVDEDTRPLAQIRSLQSELSRINSKIGEADKKRQNCDLRDGVETRKDPKSSGSMEKTYSELTEELTALHSRKRAISNKLSGIRSAVRDTTAAHKTEQTRVAASILNGCSVVFATLSSSGHELMKNVGARFDIIIVDEAGQCCEPELIIPVASSNCAKNQNIPASHLVLVGDPKQLPATVLSGDRTVQRALGTSLFERVASNSSTSVHMLRTQYRMHPAISAFPSTHFYDGRLVNGENVSSKKIHQSFHFDKQLRFGPLSFFDTSKTNSNEVRTAGGSLCNSVEAKIIVSAVTSLVRIYKNENFKGKIAILSPYKQQVTLLKRLLSENRNLHSIAVEVSTIDGIQGREKSIVFLSTVRSGHGRGIGFVDDDRRINVAMTRAKHSLIIFGHSVALGQGSRLWDSLITHCRSRSLINILPAEGKHFFPESAPRANIQAAPRLPPLRELAHPDSTGRVKLQCAGQDGSAKSKHAPTRGIPLRSKLPSPTPVTTLQHRTGESSPRRPSPNEGVPSGAVGPRLTDRKETVNAGEEIVVNSALANNGQENADRDQTHTVDNPSMRLKNPGETPFVRASSRHTPGVRRAALAYVSSDHSQTTKTKTKFVSNVEPKGDVYEVPCTDPYLSAKEKTSHKNARERVSSYSPSQPGNAIPAKTPGRASEEGDDETFSTYRAKSAANILSTQPNERSHGFQELSSRLHPSRACDQSLRSREWSEDQYRENEFNPGKCHVRPESRNERKPYQTRKEASLAKIEERQVGPRRKVQARKKSILHRLGEHPSEPYRNSLRSCEPNSDQGFELTRDGRGQASVFESRSGHNRSLNGHLRSDHCLEKGVETSKKGLATQSSTRYNRNPRTPQTEDVYMSREMAANNFVARSHRVKGDHTSESHLSQRVRTVNTVDPNAGRQATQNESTLRSRSTGLPRRPDRAAIESRLIADSKGKKRNWVNHEADMKQKRQRVAAQPSGQAIVQTQRNQEGNHIGTPLLSRMKEQMRQTNRMRRTN